MAAKQGTLAQLSQAGEDAKRAVLSRTGVTSAWFSNLNTVCTIKSAPPRNPEVLQTLATKSGWLFKRNEQHVWQARWCCAVPHTFLYYFDANVVPTNGGASGSSPPVLPQPTQQQQEEWNRAIAVGYGNRKQHEKRSNFYLFNNHNTATASIDPLSTHKPKPNSAAVSYNNTDPEDNIGAGEFKEADLTSGHFSANIQPSGIIDLECYTNIHRSSANANILELAGDDQVNPDLRAFYFCAMSQAESEDWSEAILNGRHSAVADECETYKQVCEGFVQQLQMLHDTVDESTKAQEEANAELYRVRCQMEEMRRNVRRVIGECFERALVPTIDQSGSNVSDFNDEFKIDNEAPLVRSPSTDEATPIHAKRLEFSSNLETIHSQDMGVPALVRLLAEYCAYLEDSILDMHAEKTSLEREVKQTGRSDQERVQQIKEQLETLKHQKDSEICNYKETLTTLQEKYQQSQKELQDVQHVLSSTRMEVAMYQTQQKTKIAELNQHKKILKKEVLELRTAVEEKTSKIREIEIIHETDKLAIEQEKTTTALLERYIAKVENQVQVQQSMMEMMSQSGIGSVFGGGGSVYVSGGHNEIASNQQHSVRGAKSINGSPGVLSSSSKVGENDFERKTSEFHTERTSTTIVSRNMLDDGDDENDEDDDDNELDDELQRPVNMSFGADNSHRTAQRGNHSSGDKEVVKRNQSSYSPKRKMKPHRLMMEHDIDNKSHVSELTEDRTQRHFEAYNQFAGTQPSVTSPRTFDMIHNDYTTRKFNAVSPKGGPPLHIFGVKKKSKTSGIVNIDDENDDGGESLEANDGSEHGNLGKRSAVKNSPISTLENDSEHNNRNKRSAVKSSPISTLDTINGNGTNSSQAAIAESPAVTGSPGLLGTSTPNNGRREIPRSGTASVTSRGSQSGGKMSIAQRSRQEADVKTNTIHVAVQDESNVESRRFRLLLSPSRKESNSSKHSRRSHSASEKISIFKRSQHSSDSNGRRRTYSVNDKDTSLNVTTHSQDNSHFSSWKSPIASETDKNSFDDCDSFGSGSQTSYTSSDPEYKQKEFDYASSSFEKLDRSKGHCSSKASNISADTKGGVSNKGGASTSQSQPTRPVSNTLSQIFFVEPSLITYLNIIFLIFYSYS
jgi:hypothetical protein